MSAEEICKRKLVKVLPKTLDQGCTDDELKWTKNLEVEKLFG